MKEMRASMKIPFVTFKPLEKELDSELRNAFERVYKRSWYIEGIEDENFEKIFANLIQHSCKCKCHRYRQ